MADMTKRHGASNAYAHAFSALIVATMREFQEPDRPIDLGDVLSSALEMAAEELGGVEELVAGRPGSWEADLVRRLAGGRA